MLYYASLMTHDTPTTAPPVLSPVPALDDKASPRAQLHYRLSDWIASWTPTPPLMAMLTAPAGRGKARVVTFQPNDTLSCTLTIWSSRCLHLRVAAPTNDPVEHVFGDETAFRLFCVGAYQAPVEPLDPLSTSTS